jgi:hypothetical protein
MVCFFGKIKSLGSFIFSLRPEELKFVSDNSLGISFGVSFCFSVFSLRTEGGIVSDSSLEDLCFSCFSLELDCSCSCFFSLSFIFLFSCSRSNCFF